MNRKILRIILSFFAVMLCCTLIARGASSMTVAKVKTEPPGRGSLADEFEGTGSIRAKDKVYQSLPEDQKVIDILVNPGGEVHAGEGIVQLDPVYLEERYKEQAQEIEKLKLRMEQQRISGAVKARTPATAQAQLTLDEAADALAAAQTAHQEAQSRYDQACREVQSQNETAGQNARRETQNQLYAAAAEFPADLPTDQQTEAAALEEERARLESELAAAKENLQAAERAYRSAQGAYGIARQDEANNQANEAGEARASQAALGEMQVELDALQSKLDQLNQLKETGGVITARTDGVLESAGAGEGTITAGTEQITLIVGSMEACGTIPDEKIATVAAGDEIEVSLQGEAKKKTLEIGRVGQDEEGNYVWYADLPDGNYRAGTGLTCYYSKKSQSSYDMLIPLTALRESGGGSYVLIAEIRSGILGESYTAVKVGVTVLKKDDYLAAVETNLPGEARIITESSKYVKEGDRVRLTE
ncbi:MAG: hypothetical protein K1W22_08615 [Lachnospiraceae bacterium]